MAFGSTRSARPAWRSRWSNQSPAAIPSMTSAHNVHARPATIAAATWLGAKR